MYSVFIIYLCICDFMSYKLFWIKIKNYEDETDQTDKISVVCFEKVFLSYLCKICGVFTYNNYYYDEKKICVFFVFMLIFGV